MTHATPARRQLRRRWIGGARPGRARVRHRTGAGDGIDTKAQLTAALDRYMATRAGNAGLVVRDNRNGGFYFWRLRSTGRPTAPSRC